MAITIRAYRLDDRDAVRHICYQTGYMGSPIAPQWADEPSFANLFTSYYTDNEPQSTIVAERNGIVVGYLLGCRDTEQSTRPSRIFLQQVVTRLIAFRPGTAGFVRRSIGDTATGLLRHEMMEDRFIDSRWPAHLHINLLPEARGQGGGTKLVRRWLDQLERDGVSGCHLETVAENVDAIAFFASCGFERRGSPQRAPGLRAPDGTRHSVQLMVRNLSGRAESGEIPR